MQPIQFVPITPGELRLNGADLFEAHQQEAGLAIGTAGLAPQWQIADSLYDAGDLLLVGAYSGRSLVGYGACVVSEHMNTGATQAVVTAIYLSPEYRSGAGNGLAEALKHEAKQAGAKTMMWSAKIGSKFDNVLSKTRGLQRIEHVYYEEL